VKGRLDSVRDSVNVDFTRKQADHSTLFKMPLRIRKRVDF